MALHKKGIVYRDLKPNNIMLDLQGHVKLIDFNLSKSGFHRLGKRTNSFCGSYAYMPPEIITHQSYDMDVDWYLVGVLLYEMLTGLPPYFHKSSKIIQKNIVNNKLEMPGDISEECADLIKNLLHKEPSKRLVGSDVLNHPWFAGITLDQIEAKEGVEKYESYLSEPAQSIAEGIDKKTKLKMKEFNLKYQKQIQGLIDI